MQAERSDVPQNLPPHPEPAMDHSPSIYSLMLALSVVIILSIIGVYDVLCLFRVIPAETVSSDMYIACKQYPLLPFLLGVLVCHLLKG